LVRETNSKYLNKQNLISEFYSLFSNSSVLNNFITSIISNFNIQTSSMQILKELEFEFNVLEDKFIKISNLELESKIDSIKNELLRTKSNGSNIHSIYNKSYCLKSTIKYLFNDKDNIDLLKIIYIKGNNIISHAGVSKTFLEIHDIKNILDINDIFNFDRSILEFSKTCYDEIGDDPSSSPIWIRPNSLILDKVPDYKQIVGHTRVPYINTIEDITFCDCLGKVVDCYKF
jgi:hypothetical protein